MSSSILTSTKMILGISEGDDSFDFDVMVHINSAFATLNELGIGPVDGFDIADATPTWDAFIGGDKRLNDVKTYVYMRVRLLFDPPGTSYLLTAWEKQIQQFEWRLNVKREATGWQDPSVPAA